MKTAVKTCFPEVKAGQNKSSLAIDTEFNIQSTLKAAYIFLQGVLGEVINEEA